MLYSQIPHNLLEEISGRLTVDLKLIRAEFSETPKEKSLHSKIQIIEEYLSEQGKIGNIRSPKSYIQGTEDMRWGSYPSGLVYFGSESDVILGLGGSEKHVVGNVGCSHAHSHSATPYLVAALKEQLRGFNGPLGEGSESIALAGVELATTQMVGTLQKMEFLAKKLVCFPNDSYEYTWGGRSNRPVILGSPIYVAQAD